MNPTKGEVRFVPTTGNKRPYEVWLYASHWYQRGSFSTEAKALAKLELTGKLFGWKA